MAPNQNYILTDASGEPVSRTYQYRKVMKPMLERKRRARINRCLDELKELMTNALQTVSILTLTEYLFFEKISAIFLLLRNFIRCCFATFFLARVADFRKAEKNQFQFFDKF